jgi:tetratricopeptide (TPR) repeat protein
MAVLVLLGLAGGWWIGRQMGAPTAAQQSRQELEKQAAILQQRIDQGQASDPEKQRLLELLVGLNRLEQASRLLEQMADQQPERWRLRLLLADLRHDLGDRDGAEREVRQVLNVLPEQIEALQLFTRLQLETGRGPEAAIALRAVYAKQSKPELRPGALAVGLLLADLERQLGQTAQAESTCSRLASDFPRDPRPLLALALIRQDQGKTAAAQDLLRQARERAGTGAAQSLDQVASAWGLVALRGRDRQNGSTPPPPPVRGLTPAAGLPPQVQSPATPPRPGESVSPGLPASPEPPQRSLPSPASPAAPTP